MIAGFIVHVVAYVAVCGLLVAVWALTGGSLGDISEYADDPGTIDSGRFWPVWPILVWGTVIVIHFGAVLGFGLFGRKRRRARRAVRAAIQERARGAAAAGGRGQDHGLRAGGRTSPRGPERRWVTVMFTDIVDSTGMNEALGDEAWSELLRAHRELVRTAFVARDGTEVSTQGDGFLARFDAPSAAVLCAGDIQRALRERESDDGAPRPVPAVRIGIHAGEAVEDDGDLVGRVVNLASRVAAEAGPGEILVTEPVADHLGGDVVLQDRGVRTLKGVSRPRHLLSVRWEAASTQP